MIMVSAAISPGCTRLVVHEGDGDVRIESGIGIVQLESEPGRQPQIIQSEGLGVMLRDGGITFGYFSSDIALLPIDDCRIVVWLDENTSPELLLKVSEIGDSVCSLGPGAQLQEAKQ